MLSETLRIERNEDSNEIPGQKFLAVLGYMTAGLTHEFNNSLATLKLIGQQMGDMSDSHVDSQELVTDLLFVIDGMGKVVKDLRRLTSQAAHEDAGYYSLNEAVTDSIDICKGRFKQCRILAEVDTSNQDNDVFGKRNASVRTILCTFYALCSVFSPNEDNNLKIKVMPLGPDQVSLEIKSSLHTHPQDAFMDELIDSRDGITFEKIESGYKLTFKSVES